MSVLYEEAQERKQYLAQKEICLPVILIQRQFYVEIQQNTSTKRYQSPINQQYNKSKHQLVCFHRYKFCSCLGKTTPSFSSPVSNICKDECLKFKANRKLANWSPEIFKIIIILQIDKFFSITKKMLAKRPKRCNVSCAIHRTTKVRAQPSSSHLHCCLQPTEKQWLHLSNSTSSSGFTS